MEQASRALAEDLRPIEIEKIRPNEKNPRGPNFRDRDELFEYLKNSIKAHGLLVPLVVAEQEDGTYLLIDGERRLRALQALRERTAPAHVLHGELDDEALLTTMFHIHMNQQGWGAREQCRALEPLYKQLVAEHGAENQDAIAAEISGRTGTQKGRARERTQFLRWPETIKSEIYGSEDTAPYWYVVEIERGIIEPARRNFPEYFEQVSVDEVREFLYRKYKAGTVKAAVEVRDGAHIARRKLEGEEREQTREILARLVTDTEYSFAQAKEDFAARFPQYVDEAPPWGPRRLQNQVKQLAQVISEYEPEFLSPPSGHGVQRAEMRDALQLLAEAVEEFMGKLAEEE